MIYCVFFNECYVRTTCGLPTHPTHNDHTPTHTHTLANAHRNDWWLGRLWDRLTSLCCYSGFLRSDTLIGTVTVKLQPLETVCELHDSFDVSIANKRWLFKQTTDTSSH